MRTVIIIPARYESTRFPGKPLALIDGKPLIQRTWEAARESRYGNSTFVATDSYTIADCVRGFGGNVILTGQYDNGTERCAWAGMTLGLGPNDVVINLQGDSPTIPPGLLHLLGDSMQSGDYPVSTLVTPASKPPAPGDVFAMMNYRWEAMYFDRNPDLPQADVHGDLYRHIGIYAYQFQALMKYVRWPKGVAETNAKLEQLRWLERGERIKCLEAIPNDVYPEVNYPEDIERVEAYMRRRCLLGHDRQGNVVSGVGWRNDPLDA